MQRSYHHWYSPTLNREMELLVFGQHGAPVVVFPTAQDDNFYFNNPIDFTANLHDGHQLWLLKQQDLLLSSNFQEDSWPVKASASE